MERLSIIYAKSWISVCSEFVQMNQIIINSIKYMYAICDIHIEENFSKYFIYNESSLNVFQWDFTYNIIYLTIKIPFFDVYGDINLAGQVIKSH